MKYLNNIAKYVKINESILNNINTLEPNFIVLYMIIFFASIKIYISII